MDLTRSDLTGYLVSILPDNPHGLPELQKLHLQDTELNKDDVQHLTYLIQTHKMSGLEELNLSYNRLNKMETDVEDLIEACVTHHQRELRLWLRSSRLSNAFEEKWKRRCVGIKIKLDFSFFRKKNLIMIQWILDKYQFSLVFHVIDICKYFGQSDICTDFSVC